MEHLNRAAQKLEEAAHELKAAADDVELAEDLERIQKWVHLALTAAIALARRNT